MTDEQIRLVSEALGIQIRYADTSDFEDGEVRPLMSIGSLPENWDGKLKKCDDPYHGMLGIDKDKNSFTYHSGEWYSIIDGKIKTKNKIMEQNTEIISSNAQSELGDTIPWSDTMQYKLIKELPLKDGRYEYLAEIIPAK